MVSVGFGLGQLITHAGILSPELAHNYSAAGMPASMIPFITTVLFGTVNCRGRGLRACVRHTNAHSGIRRDLPPCPQRGDTLGSSKALSTGLDTSPMASRKLHIGRKSKSPCKTRLVQGNPKSHNGLRPICNFL